MSDTFPVLKKETYKGHKTISVLIAVIKGKPVYNTYGYTKWLANKNNREEIDQYFEADEQQKVDKVYMDSEEYDRKYRGFGEEQEIQEGGAI